MLVDTCTELVLSKGIQYMLQHGFLKDEKPLSIAEFLLHTEGLSKAQIGEYLGDP